MQGATAPVLFLAHVWFCQTCSVINEVLICRSIPSEFSPGNQILVMVLQNAGKINSTVFQRNGFGSITTLILDGSNITEISENAFGSAPQLRSLSLDRNNLSEMNSNWFQDPAALNTLSLVENQIEVVNATTLHGLTNLKQLRLGKNRIRTIHHDSFNALILLTEVDLSENRLTRLSTQLLRSLGSLRSISLHGNPWGCMCDSEAFVASLRDLQNRSVLVQPTQVTCETPPSLKGQPIFNATVCLMKTEPTTVFTSTESISSSPSASEPSVQTSPPITVSASSAKGTSSPRMTRTSTSSMNTGSHPSSSVYSKPTFTPFTVLKPTGATVSASSPPPAPDSNILWTLVSIVVLLSVLLGMVCFLLAMHKQKRSSKTVTPECPGEEDQEKQRGQEVSGSNINLSSKSSELRGPEMASRTCFRAKSAHAVILTAPFGVSGRDELTFQAETEESCEVSVNPQDRKQNPASVTEVGQHHLTSLTIMEALKEHKRGGEERRDLKENLQSLSVSTDVVPYLSIGRGQNEPGPDKESTEGPGQSPQRSPQKVMSRISTWPPTAAQWQARCKMKEEEDDEELDVWTGGAAEKTVNQTKPPGGSDHHNKEDEINHPESSTHRKELKEEEELQEEEELSEKAAGGTGDGISQRHQRTSPEKAAHKSGKSSKAEAAPRKQSKAAGSKAPSGGATPDDETLLSGNEYVFMNLLHEVAHNNGRWTRERWKQTHLNKQRL